MAQDESSQPSSIRYIKGLFKDTSHIDQPAGTLRYAKNAVVNKTYGAISNEEGNTLMESLPEHSLVIGTIPLSDDKIVIFLKLNNPGISGDTQYWIGIYENNLFVPILKHADLYFEESNPIEGTFTTQSDGDVVVYWTDDLNPPRALNITRHQLGSNGLNVIYSRANSLASILDLFPNAGITPHIELSSIDMGGACKTGTYYLALAYTDADYTTTNFVTVANPVSIVPAPEGVYPIESYDGAPPNISTGKSIKWSISNINTHYDYITPAIVFNVGKGKQAVKLPPQSVNNLSNIDIVYTGREVVEEFSVEEIVIGNVSYEKAKTISQLDGVMYLGNLKSKKELGYQKYANFIKLTSVTKTFNPFDSYNLSENNLNNKFSTDRDRTQGYRDDENIFRFKGYTREEVYAFYIAFILKDGSMSEAYHIPGRKPMTDVPVVQVPELNRTDYWSGGIIPATVNEADLINTQGGIDYSAMNITGGAWTGELLSHFFHWYDFSAATGSTPNEGMNYWHNLNEFYPDTEDFDVVDALNPSVVYPSLRGLNVRHHRFPSNLNEEKTTVKSSNASALVGDLESRTKITLYYTWFGFLDGVGGGLPTSQTDEYVISDFSGTDISVPAGGSASYTAVQAWSENTGSDTPMSDNDSGWGTLASSCNSCDPATNSLFQLDTYQSGSNPFWGSGLYTQCDYGCDLNPNMLGNAFWRNHTGCSGTGSAEYFDEYEIKYSPGMPPVGTMFVGGWNMNTVSVDSGCSPPPPNCGMHIMGTVTASNGTSMTVDRNFGGWPWKVAPPRGGYLVWADCTPIPKDTTAPLEHEVQALGIKLSELRVPQDIWNKTQGFRIYYAKRSHENRTVLGQNPIHNMWKSTDVDTAHCDGYVASEGSGIVSSSDFLFGPGLPAPRKVEWGNSNDFAFHDFYLLNGQKDISPATHIKVQYGLSMFQYKGNVNYYDDEVFSSDLTETGDQVCLQPDSYTGFFASGHHGRMPDYHLNYILRDKAKAYINGGDWVKAKTFGFGNDIYNLGGETFIGLATTKAPPFTISRGATGWDFGQTPPNGSDISFVRYTAGDPLLTGSNEYLNEQVGLQYLLVNLKAFKTDVYSSFDTQELVWTGYEVVGAAYGNHLATDFGNWVDGEVDPTGNPYLNPVFPGLGRDRGIYGGDTFICRHGYRMTSRLEAAHDYYWPSSTDLKSLFFTIVESTDNINFRHIEGPSSSYFPGTAAADILDIKADVDLTKGPDLETGNMKYNEAYSEVNDIMDVFPQSITTKNVDEHPARVVRSNKLKRDSLVDTYRVFKEDQYRELPTHKGELWKLIAAENLMYFHMEDTLFKTKGKQKMKLGDGSDAYVGSGDIFAQDPDEVIMADTGYIGTRAQRASIVTPFGYFSVDTKTKKVFLSSKSGPMDLTGEVYGMKRWFQKNIPFALEEYGFDGLADNPIKGLGFHAVWDERYNRVILTKRDIFPKRAFVQNYNGSFDSITAAHTAGIFSGIISVEGSFYIFDDAPFVGIFVPLEIKSTESNWLEHDNQYFEKGGWTVSFTVDPSQGKVGSWTSFHDYVPYIYSTSKLDFYSFVRGETTAIDAGIYRHAGNSPLGRFYGDIYNFEIEVVHNLQRGQNKLFYSMNWLADVLEPQESGNRDIKDFNAGFTSYIVYSSDANSGEIPLEYMINTRKTGGSWKVNQFRDMSKEVSDASIYYTGAPFTGGNYGITGVTVAGTVTTSVTTAISSAMFTVDGMNEIFNTAYVDTGKPWHKRGKFIDRFLAFRLICNNIDNNLINLYNTEAPFRPQER